jgi:hypothetical protein
LTYIDVSKKRSFLICKGWYISALYRQLDIHRRFEGPQLLNIQWLTGIRCAADNLTYTDVSKERSDFIFKGW